MKLFVYKGFSAEFLSAVTVLPLVDTEIATKKNVLLFDNKVRRSLDRALLSIRTTAFYYWRSKVGIVISKIT